MRGFASATAMQLHLDRFYRHADLTAILNAFVARRPDLFSIESIGRSHEGRDIWLMTVARRRDAAPGDRPAFWVDGNIHACELTASTACLHFLQALEEGETADPDIRRLLDTRTVYVCPRINPDGAEWALADKPKYIRSSTRPYPFDEEPVDGLDVEDIDGDGRILSMRMPDPNGNYKEHPEDPRLMTPRDSAEPDDHMPPEDLWLYKIFGRKSTELTGYPNISIFHEFKYHPKKVITGGFDWIYEHLGQFFWTVEIWAPLREAGIENYHFTDWYREHPPEDDLKLLRWSDRELGGEGYVTWYPFEHPQLGAVELGGWNRLPAFRNPPAKYREREVRRFPRWLTWQALTTPRLEVLRTEAAALGSGTWKVRLVVHNTGYLPSDVTKRSLERKVTRGVIYEIGLPPGAELIGGKPPVEGGQLEGRAGRLSLQAFLPDPAMTSDRGQCEWTVRAPAGARLTLTARHDRAGRAMAEVVLQ